MLALAYAVIVAGHSGATLTGSPALAVTGFTNAIAVAAGIENFLALTSDGSVWAWGSDGFGQFGDGIFSEGIQTPVQVSGLSNIVAICSGYYHCLALDTNGQVWAWGLNSSGQLGDNGAEYDSALPVLVFSNATQIAAGIAHSLAVDTQGGLWAWGSDSAGQLGDAGSAKHQRPNPGFGYKQRRCHRRRIRCFGCLGWQWERVAVGQLR